MGPAPSPDEVDEGNKLRNSVNMASSAQHQPLSCSLCRAKKLKCSREYPRCARCVRLHDTCVYPKSRRSEANVGRNKRVADLADKIDVLEQRIKTSHIKPRMPREILLRPDPIETDDTALSSGGQSTNNALTRSPSLNLPDVLTHIFFEKTYHASPVLHRGQYMTSLDRSTHPQPPACLRYMIMATAASSDDSYRHLAPGFYRLAKSSALADEMDILTNTFATAAHAQCWSLMANYEAQQAMFLSAATSLSRGIRIAQMIGLHRLDGPETESDGSSPGRESDDSIELEEKRRTWWTLFCSDRCVSGVVGWPLMIHEGDISTHLPVPEEAFASGTSQQTSTLSRILRHEHDGPYSSLAARSLASQLLCKAMQQSPRLCSNEESGDTYWKRHREIDNDLAAFLLSLPTPLRLPGGIRCQGAVFINIMIHTAAICLHRSALRELESRSGFEMNLPDVEVEALEHQARRSRMRMVVAGDEILAIFRMVADLTEALRNPMLVFAAYMAALVSLQGGDLMPEVRRRENLDFILRIMTIIRGHNAVARLFAEQLAGDMKSIGLKSRTDNTGLAQTEFGRDELESGHEENGKTPPIFVQNEDPGSARVLFAPRNLA